MSSSARLSTEWMLFTKWRTRGSEGRANLQQTSRFLSAAKCSLGHMLMKRKAESESSRRNFKLFVHCQSSVLEKCKTNGGQGILHFFSACGTYRYAYLRKWVAGRKLPRTFPCIPVIYAFSPPQILAESETTKAVKKSFQYSSSLKILSTHSAPDSIDSFAPTHPAQHVNIR